jgi:hypothetical protein
LKAFALRPEQSRANAFPQTSQKWEGLLHDTNTADLQRLMPTFHHVIIFDGNMKDIQE